MKFKVIILIITTMLLVGCNEASASVPKQEQQAARSARNTSAEMKTITLDDNNTSFSGGGASVSDGSVTITEGGSYLISGNLSDGRIAIDTASDVCLVFNGVDIISSKRSAIVSNGAGKVTIEIARDTENRIADGERRAKKKDRNADTNAVIYTNGSLEITGEGVLDISGNHRGGMYSEQSVEIFSGTLNIEAKGLGIYSRQRLAVHGGNVSIDNKDDEGAESDEIIINGGNIRIISKQDALNAQNNIVINGGNIYVEANDDGFDSNDTMTINGGTIFIFAKNSALDVSDGKKIGTFTINGGTVVAVGGDYRIAADSRSEQGFAWLDAPRLPKGAGSASVFSESGEKIIDFDYPNRFSLVFVSTERVRNANEGLRLRFD
ncbi:MAG: carbohydrate-binding domain-containing protein [Defluviitaleaceae bacterium]|nr:carbohydrate-binding domain-containing protein [Defluviitaleaceae bacterium]